MDVQRLDDQLEPTYISSVPIQDVALRTSRKQWTIGRGGESGSGISVVMVWRDDNDDNFYDHKEDPGYVNSSFFKPQYESHWCRRSLKHNILKPWSWSMSGIFVVILKHQFYTSAPWFYQLFLHVWILYFHALFQTVIQATTIFIIKGFRTIVFIFTVTSTTFRPICSPAFFRCLSNSGTFTELQTTSFIEYTGSPVLIP